MAATVTREELLELAEARAEELRSFLDWASDVESRSSMRLRDRPDIPHAAEAAALFPPQWWGLVVFTCFGSLIGARAAAPHFQEPLPPEIAEHALSEIEFPRRSVGHHRIQPGVTGAKRALVGACARAEMLERVLHSSMDFEERYAAVFAEKPHYWGRTTIFDLLLRAGALKLGGRETLPTLAYLAGSTGPASGFRKVFGISISDENATWAEAVLRSWTEPWQEIADLVGADWDGEPYTPGDFENALCIWQEPRR